MGTGRACDGPDPMPLTQATESCFERRVTGFSSRLIRIFPDTVGSGPVLEPFPTRFRGGPGFGGVRIGIRMRLGEARVSRIVGPDGFRG